MVALLKALEAFVCIESVTSSPKVKNMKGAINRAQTSISFPSFPPIHSFPKPAVRLPGYRLILIIIFWRHEDAERGVIAGNIQIQTIRAAGQPQVPRAGGELAAREAQQLHRHPPQEDQPAGPRQPQPLAKPAARHRNPLPQEQEPEQLRRPHRGEQEAIDLLHLALRDRPQQL